MTLDVGVLVEGDVVADRHDVLLIHLPAVVEEPLPDPDTEQSPDHALERRALEELVGQSR